jgi:hypothetical protein
MEKKLLYNKGNYRYFHEKDKQGETCGSSKIISVKENAV